MKATENLVQVSGAIIFKSFSKDFLRVSVIVADTSARTADASENQERKNFIDVYFFGEKANEYNEKFENRDQVHIDGMIETRKGQLQTIVGTSMEPKKTMFGECVTDLNVGRKVPDENKFIVAGELVRCSESESKRFVIATIRTIAGTRPSFVKIQMYGKTIERIQKIAEGTPVVVEGHISTSLTKKDGKTVKKEFCVAHRVSVVREATTTAENVTE